MQTGYKVYFAKNIELPWSSLVPIKVGPATSSSPEVHVLLEKAGDPALRIDVFTDIECRAFKKSVVWGNWVVVGYGCRVHFISVDGKALKSYKFPDYFGHLYTSDDFRYLSEHENFILVASGSQLWRFNVEAEAVWQAKDLAIDGVVVHDIKEGIVYGDAEWDPPGGWKSFTVELKTGCMLCKEKKPSV